MKSANLFSQPLTTILLALGLGLGLTLTTVAGLALAHEAGNPLPPASSLLEKQPAFLITSTAAVTTDFSFVRNIAYARIITDNPVSVYRHPLDQAQGLPPARFIEPGFMFVSLEKKEPVTFANGTWYEINKDEYVRAEVLTPYIASTFRGTEVLT